MDVRLVELADYCHMSRPKPVCFECGCPIDFRWIGGKARPFHARNTACKKPRVRSDRFAQQLFSFPALYAPAFEQAVTKGGCHCGAAVLQVKHLHGTVYFDRVEWPWERHVCADRSNVDFGLDVLARRLESGHGQPSLGLVAGAYKTWTANPVHLVAVEELAPGGKRFCLRMRGDPDLPEVLRKRERVEPGSLVALCKNGEIKLVLNANGLELQCTDQNCSPEELGIPEEWNSSDLVLI